jgi:hypothetical protein
MSPRPTLIACLLAAAAALTPFTATAKDGVVDLGFGEVPGYTAFGIPGQTYIDVGGVATSRYDRTWVFVEGLPMDTQLHVGRMISSSGLLDTGFGPNQDGRRSVTMPAGIVGPAVNGAIARDDGTPIVFGRLRGAIDGDHAGFVCRFAAAGNLFPSFGSNGCTVVRSMIAGNEWLEVTAAAEDNFGRIVIAGGYYQMGQQGGDEYRFLARLTENGVLDPEFAGGVGFITLPHYAGDGAYQSVDALRVDDQGRILLLSTISIDFSDGDLDALLQRFDDGGSPDPDFANAGARLISFDQGEDEYDSGVDFHLLPDGRIVVLTFRSDSSTPIALMRFDANATQFDPAFNGGAARLEALPQGVMLPYFAPLAIDDLGRSYVVLDGGTIAQRWTAILRHRIDGSPDPSFGVAGRSQVTGQMLTGDPTLNAFKTIGVSVVDRDQLLITATLNNDDINAKRALNYTLTAGGIFRDSFD